MKLWQKQYKLDKNIESFTVGNDFMLDKKLIKYDCLGSIAHAKTLTKAGVLNNQELAKLKKELQKIIKLADQKKFKITPSQEDCHTAIENYLTKSLGKIGKKIHTGRSRNDQVLTALRLYYKDELLNTKKYIIQLIKTLEKFIKKYGHIKWPGYTHTRKAMPSSLNLWTNALIDSMQDNLKLLNFVLNLIDQSPLGTGAGYGVPLKLDRKYSAKLLHFSRIQKNSIYVQNSRGKFESSILHTLSQIMFDLNKIASDLIIFSMPEFNYFELPEELCTGSSIMPQKKNPDVLELLRSKYHIINSYELRVKNITANLISGYHRDMQLTKEPVMKGFEIIKQSLFITELFFSKLKVNEAACNQALTDEIFATDQVYKLIETGVPFREAYKKIANKYKI